MTNKNLLHNTRGSTSPEGKFVPRSLRKKTPKAPLESFVSVRSQKQIPSSVLEFFKQDPRTGQAFSAEEKLLNAQVCMHEIDEGCRLLSRAEKPEDARFLGQFSHRLHLNQRLELLRQKLEDSAVTELSTERISQAHKARNDQCGAVQMRLGPHPALAVTQIGVGYKNRNEDAFLLMPQKKVMALADGMGGHVGGNIASGIAIDFFEYGVSQGMEIDEAIAFANQAILARSKSDEHLNGMRSMGCTFAAFQILGNVLKIAHVGDTKVLLLRGGAVYFETQDHTQGQQLLQEGLIDCLTAFELNHILNRCLGIDSMRAKRDVSVTGLEIKVGDRILIATDGLTDNFFDGQFKLDEIARFCREGSLLQCANSLMETCLSRMAKNGLPDGRSAKCDNVTLGLAEFQP